MASLEDIRHDADVVSSDGKTVGNVYAIVLAPGSNEVTHIGVDTGPHFPEPGFGDPKVLVVDIDHIVSADGEKVTLDLTRDGFAKSPPYEHTHFFRAPDAEQPPDESLGGRVWNAGIAIAKSLATLGSGIAVPAEHLTSSTFERSILNDAPVWRQEPNVHIGDVKRVLVDGETDEVHGLVIKSGVFFQHEVVLPIRFVSEIHDGIIDVNISDAELDSLEKFAGD
jgi:sporulation protein YlmC with PRC-barrel domain